MGCRLDCTDGVTLQVGEKMPRPNTCGTRPLSLPSFVYVVFLKICYNTVIIFHGPGGDSVDSYTETWCTKEEMSGGWRGCRYLYMLELWIRVESGVMFCLGGEG